ncbi:hypothetical protein [Sporosarcina sp. FSL W7-1283]|uniref:hypothetical protein n=1 Tax=Sporosarcina sp. FSL W7-1283 TaxID=2921560 RepID=UPI0030F994E9
MNVHALKEHIINNEEFIPLILESVGFVDVDGSFGQGNDYRCAWEDGSNPTSVQVRKDTLSSNYFAKGLKGDLITLVREKKGLSFPDTLKLIKKIIKYEECEIEVKLPFGGFFNEVLNVSDNNYADLETYSETILDEYLLAPSKMFLEDGISYDVQSKYKIFYDVMSDRIGVPWRSLSGDIVGIMGRLNKHELEEWESKWLPLIAFPKSKTIFGFSENYSQIQNEGLLFLGESEKSPMQLSSKNIDLGLALGGNTLSQFQANNIKSLFAKKIIIMLDEGLEESKSIEIAEQLKMDTFFRNEVFYIYDKNNKYLPSGSKMSPSDLTKRDFKKLVMECSRKV